MMIRASRYSGCTRIASICCFVMLATACSGSPNLNDGEFRENKPAQLAVASIPLHKLPLFTGDFGLYRQQVQSFLQQHSLPHRSENDIALNLPFELKAEKDVPYRGKFLLLHGLNDSPYVWSDIAPELASRGFDVRAPLFEGHGSTPKAMLDVSYRDWLQTARTHYNLWNDSDSPVFIAGFSMGAVLATILALENNKVSEQAVAGLLLVSPAFQSRLNHYLRWSGLYAKFKPWVFGGMILEDNPIKYNSIPVNSGWQFYKTTRYLKKILRGEKLDIPVLMINSANDSVVDTDVVRSMFRKHFEIGKSKLLTYHEHPLPDSTANELYRLSSVEGTRILNQSHLGLMYKANNSLFGQAGKILVCNGNEYPVFIACLRARNHWLGAQHTISPDGMPVARITYNTDFQTMLDLLDEVLLR